MIIHIKGCEDAELEIESPTIERLVTMIEPVVALVCKLLEKELKRKESGNG